MMPDHHGEESFKTDLERDDLVGRIGCMYVRAGLSPPFALRDAMKSWRGLTPDEIVAVIEKHFEDCRRFYTAGSGDAHFNIVRAAISKALDAKLAWGAPATAERPREKRRGRVRKLHHAGGVDAFDDREDPAWICEVPQPRPAPPESYRESGESVGEDVDPD